MSTQMLNTLAAAKNTLTVTFNAPATSEYLQDLFGFHCEYLISRNMDMMEFIPLAEELHPVRVHAMSMEIIPYIGDMWNLQVKTLSAKIGFTLKVSENKEFLLGYIQRNMKVLKTLVFQHVTGKQGILTLVGDYDWEYEQTVERLGVPNTGATMSIWHCGDKKNIFFQPLTRLEAELEDYGWSFERSLPWTQGCTWIQAYNMAEEWVRNH